VADIAHALGMKEKKAKQVRDVSHLTILSLEAPSDARNNTATLQDTIPSQTRSVEKVVYAREQHRLIMQAVQTLEQRSGDMLIQHHGLDGQGGMSLAEIGRARGLSRERVRQITHHAHEQLPAFSANTPPAHARERARKSLPGAGLRAGEGVKNVR